MKNWNWYRIGLHLLFWTTYVPLNAIINCLLNRKSVEEFFNQAIIGETYSLPVKIALTYFVFYFVIPLYFDRKQLWKMIGLIVAGFAVGTVLYRFILVFLIFPLLDIPQPPHFFTWPNVSITLFDLFITVTAATIIKLIRVHYASRDFEQQLIREKLQSELNFLRAQTNPHFLFNTLNNIYVLAWKKSEKTADAIMMLSKIMRFVLYDCRAARIRVVDEAKIVQDFLELERLRYTKRLQIKYSESIDNPETFIAPLLLLPFVENAFKHGANSTTGDAEILIHLQLRENELSFKVENTVEEDDEKSTAPAVEGIGLKNVKRQLDLIYPERHKLGIETIGDRFLVNLNINLNES